MLQAAQRPRVLPYCLLVQRRKVPQTLQLQLQPQAHTQPIGGPRLAVMAVTPVMLVGPAALAMTLAEQYMHRLAAGATDWLR